MKALLWAALIAISIAAGYVVRDLREPDTSDRQTREVEDPETTRKRVLERLSEEQREAFLVEAYPELVRLRTEDQERRARAQQEAADAAATEELDADAEADAVLEKFRGAMRSQLPAWKAQFGVNAKGIGMQIAKELGLTGEQAKQFAAAYKAEGSLAAERVMGLFTGEFEGSSTDIEATMDSFYWFYGSAGIMSESLAGDLGKIVGDEDVAAAREEMRVRNKQQIDKQVEMQVAMMSLPDLSEQQRAEVKEVFGGGGMMKEQSKMWGAIMKDPRKLLSADSDEKWAKVIEPSMHTNRVRMKAILSEKQFTAYRDYEKMMVAQSRMWIEPYLKSARAAK